MEKVNQMTFGEQNQPVIIAKQAELDFLPEYCQYSDEGCELAGSCLQCPLERCIYDEPGGKNSLLKKWRDHEIGNLYRSQKKTIKELAEMFDVSTRTVQRALKGTVLNMPAQGSNRVSRERRTSKDVE